jgi:hypothetical protein
MREVEPDVRKSEAHHLEGPFALLAVEDHRDDLLATSLPLDLDRFATAQIPVPGWGSIRAAISGTDEGNLVDLHVGDEHLSHLTAVAPPGSKQQDVVYSESLDAEADAEVSKGNHVNTGPPTCRHLVELGTPWPPRRERSKQPHVNTRQITPVTRNLFHLIHPLYFTYCGTTRPTL